MNFLVLILVGLFSHIYALTDQKSLIQLFQQVGFTAQGVTDPTTGIYTPDDSEIPDPSYEGTDVYGLNVTTTAIPLRVIQNYWRGSPTCEKNIIMRTLQYDARPGCHKV